MTGEAADTRELESHRGPAAPARKGSAPPDGTGQQRFCHWHPVLPSHTFAPPSPGTPSRARGHTPMCMCSPLGVTTLVVGGSAHGG